MERRWLLGLWSRLSTLCLNMSVSFVAFHASAHSGRRESGRGEETLKLLDQI